MRKVITLGYALALAACGAPIPPRECQPTLIQPARGAAPRLLNRVAGCPNLVAVSGGPGITLYVLRANLANVADGTINALPLAQRGEG